MSAVRRSFVLLAVAALFAGAFGPVPVQGDQPPKGGKKMHGLIARITAVDFKRDQLIAILLQGSKDMPGCLSYIVAKDPTDTDVIWVTEVWEDLESQRASLSLPAVKEALAKARPLVARFDRSTPTEPVGGHGLVPVKR
jgi:quinol monooxygenase YgiN